MLLDLLTPDSAKGWWIAGISVGIFIASLVGIPLALVLIPADYFRKGRTGLFGFQGFHPALRVALIAAKNLLGLLLLVGGIAMLVLPGQGLLGILMGISLLDFPGKRRLEQRFIRQKPVLNSINWIRAKAGRCPLELDSDEEGRSAPGPQRAGGQSGRTAQDASRKSG